MPLSLGAKRIHLGSRTRWSRPNTACGFPVSLLMRALMRVDAGADVGVAAGCGTGGLPAAVRSALSPAPARTGRCRAPG